MMLRFIRHKSTRAYLDKDGGWTLNPAQAQHFESVQTILSLQRRLELTEIEMILQMGPEPSTEYDIALPLRNPPARP